MSNILDVGVVGLGKMGLLHAAIMNRLPGSRVVAAVEPNSMVRQFLSNLHPAIRIFPALEEMLREVRLDAVVIATPVSDHVPAALQCVERRLPFFMEKPLAVSVRQAAELVEAAHQRPIPHMIGFMTRFTDPFEKAKEILDSHCLGQLHRVTATMYASQCFSRGQGWRYDRAKAGGGVLLAQGSHLLDLLTWYFGPMARVNAEVLSPYSAQVEDTAHLIVKFRSGLRGWVDCSWSVRFKRIVETTIEVLGEDGSLTLTDDTLSLFLDQPAGGWPKGRTLLQAPDLYRGVPVDIGGPQYTREDQSFLDAVRSNRIVEPGVAQAFHVQQIVEAAYASAQAAGAPQELSG